MVTNVRKYITKITVHLKKICTGLRSKTLHKRILHVEWDLPKRLAKGSCPSKKSRNTSSGLRNVNVNPGKSDAKSELEEPARWRHQGQASKKKQGRKWGRKSWTRERETKWLTSCAFYWLQVMMIHLSLHTSNSIFLITCMSHSVISISVVGITFARC